MPRGGARPGAGRKPGSKSASKVEIRTGADGALQLADSNPADAAQTTGAALPVKRAVRYSPELAAAICERLAEGESLRSICTGAGMPTPTAVRRWALEDRGEGFAAMYERARSLGYDAMAEELLECADDGRNDWMVQHGKEDAGWMANGENVNRSRLRVDTRKWLLSKLLPKRFGDKIEQQITGPGGGPLVSPVFNVAFVTPVQKLDG
jgi:hypothetical protein